MPVDLEVRRLQARLVPMAKFLHLLASSLERPKMYRRGVDRGFRYENPGLVHFCLLRGVRIVSALHASIELLRQGFPQEIAVLLRTMIEYSTQIDYVLASRDEKGVLSAEASTFISNFFADAYRGEADVGRRAKLVQKKVHDVVGARLDKLMAEIASEDNARKPATQLLSHIYLVFSNYVHGRYPESMDLYGGNPGKFHMDGMRGTPKDNENIEIVDTLVTSASNCLRGMALDLKLRSIITADPELEAWVRGD